jgi:6-pyruvoyltetrahydropterin/6-carboxytetrahydropterin synthase
MHTLGRQIRFWINPFSGSQLEGANSFCGKPCGEGFSLYFGLWVELIGSVKKETGFVINVSEIDKAVRNYAMKIFTEGIRKKFTNRQNISLEDVGLLMKDAQEILADKFGSAKVSSLELELSPNRKLGIKENGGNMLYISEKFEFAASHTLWNDKFSDEENEKVFGKCANKCGHGHNYIVEVTIKKSTVDEPLKAGDFERIVEQQFIRLVDHKNLNIDVEHFKKVNPTVENIAEFAFKELAEKFKPFELDCVTVWENDRTFCSYRED